MRASLLSSRLVRSYKPTTTRFITSYATPSVCQICQQKSTLFSQNTPPVTRRFASSSASSTSHSQDSASSAPSIPRNHYELFPKTLPLGPPPSGPFPIEPRTLRNEFLRLQASAHPDRHSLSMKSRAEATSALINEAYKTLLSPLLRAQYLLSLRGIDLANDEAGSVDDPELLMEVLETNEEIEDAKEEGDLEEVRTRNEGRIKESERVLEEAFKKDDLEKAKEEAVKLRYWVNIKESLDAWEQGKPVVLVH